MGPNQIELVFLLKLEHVHIYTYTYTHTYTHTHIHYTYMYTYTYTYTRGDIGTVHRHSPIDKEPKSTNNHQKLR